MKLKQLKVIEEEIDYLLQAYDTAVKGNDYDIQAKTIQCIEYELEKLDENTVHIKTPLS